MDTDRPGRTLKSVLGVTGFEPATFTFQMVNSPPQSGKDFYFANTSCSVSKAMLKVLAETLPIFFANRTLSTARI
jgi:hypothetical protein